MAEDNMPDFLKEYRDRITSEETINRLTAERDALLNRIQEFYKTNLKLTKVNSEELTKIYEQEKRRIEEEYKLKKLRSQSIADIQKELKTQQEKLKIDKAETEAKVKLAVREKDRTAEMAKLKIINEELTKLQERQLKLEESKELKANKIFNLSKAYKDIWTNITKEKQKQADLDNQALLDLYKRQYNGEDISDEQFAKARSTAQRSANAAELASQVESIMNNISSKITGMFKSMDQAVQRGVDIYSKYMGPLDARLQAITESKTLDSIFTKTESLSRSTLIDYASYLDTIDKFSSSGISYNIEERAFLETISNKIVASFNALDNTLLRMTRIQQSDMTRLMLGNEALLTKLFNEFFEDSSYLATNVSDNISASVFEAASTMNQAAASAFEFTIQKWLGALYEVGVSQETVSSIASAINALGSGNAQDFMSSPVATLLNMAVARGDYSIADVLTQGLNTDFIDDLMTSMVTLLKDIKDNTSNQVTLQAYSRVMGMSMADLRGFTNLTEDDIARLSGYSLDANGANAEVSAQIEKLVDRTTVKERIDNRVNNYLLERGIKLGKSQSSYVMYVLADLIGDMAGDSIVGNVAQAVKFSQLLASNDIKFDDIKSLDVFTMIYKAFNGLVDGYNSIKSFIWGADGILHIDNPNTSGLLNILNSANPYVRYNRGKEFTGVSPDYGANYGAVSTNLSSSIGVTATTNIGSVDAAYGQIPVFDTSTSTQQRIQNLEQTSGEIDAFSIESAQAADQQVGLSDVFRELFNEQNFPIKIHFDQETTDFFNKWYKAIHERQYDTHVTNTVGVKGSVSVSGTVSLDGASANMYNAFYNNRNS